MQTFRRVPIDSIRPHPENPNEGDEEAIRDSIEVNGWFGACVVQASTKYILVGNHRWKVEKERGATEIDVLIGDWDDDRAISIMLADNRTAEKARRNNAAVQLLVARLDDAGADLRGTGYDLQWLEDVEEGNPVDVEPIPLVDVPEFDDWESKYGVIVEVDSEQEQQLVYETLTEMGMTCRVVTA